MKKIFSLLGLLTILGSGCISTSPSPLVSLAEGSRAEMGLGSVSRVRMLDEALKEKGVTTVTAHIRLASPLRPDDLQAILEGGDFEPISFTGIIDDPQTTQIEEQIGTTPFSETFTDVSTTAALKAYWGRSVTTAFEEHFAQGLFLEINTLTVTGNADVLRGWWEDYFDQVTEIIEQPS